MSTQATPKWLERAVFAVLKLAIQGARGVLGRNNVSVRSMADYMVSLINQNRYDEVRGLLRHSLLKASPWKWRGQAHGTQAPDANTLRPALSAEQLKQIVQPKFLQTESKDRALLVVVPHLKLGGAEVLLLSILRRLSRSWHIVIVTTTSESHALAPEFAKLTTDIFHLPEMLHESGWSEFVQQIIATRAITHALSSSSRWALVNLAKIKANYPILRHVHLIHNDVPDAPFRAALTLKASIDRFAVVASRVSEALQLYGVPKSQIAEIENGVDATSLFNPARINVERFRKEAGLDGRPVLLWVGRLDIEKRPLLFLEMAEAVATQIDLQVVMIGSGPFAAAVHARSGVGLLVGRTTVIPGVAREHLPGYYAIAEMLVLTSQVEGMPLVVLEALAMGCPVAATRVGDVSRVVEPGRNGLLFEAGRPEDMVRPLVEALTTRHYGAKRAEIRARFCATPYLETKMLDAYGDLFEAT